MKTLTKSDFKLQKIEKEYQDNFVCASGTLSDFHVNAVCWVAEVFAAGSPVIWCDNNAWYDKDSTRYSLFMTENGNLMLMKWGEIDGENELYRVNF